MTASRGKWRLAAVLFAAAVAFWGSALVFADSARAMSGDFTVTPSILEFPDTYMGDSSSITVSVTNVSGAARTPTFAGGAPIDAANFGGSQDCAGATLAPGASCTFTYTFTPQATGPVASSTTIQVDGEAFGISLRGTGVFPLEVSSTTLDFPVTSVGSSSVMPVTVTNVSPAPQSPSFAGGAPIDPTNFGGSQDCAGKTLAPGESCTFNYEYRPASPGTHSTTTTISIDGVSFDVVLRGATSTSPPPPPNTGSGPTVPTTDTTSTSTSTSTSGGSTPSTAPATTRPGDLATSGAGDELPLLLLGGAAALVIGAVALALRRRVG